MRTVVMAYQDIGWVCLDELLALGADIPLVITHRDSPSEEIWFRSVAERAERADLPVLRPESVKDPDVAREIARRSPDMVFSFYFREIIPRGILDLAARGAFNLHGSLLPRYRGRCPVNWVLVHGETETGVTLHYMESKPDAGDIVAQRAVSITDDDTAVTLNRKLGEAARLLLRETFPRLLAGTAPRVPQDHSRATYFGGRRPEDGRIVWRQTARQICNLVRAVTHPYPGAFTAWGGRRVYAWAARLLPDAPDGMPGHVLAVSPGGLTVATGAGAVVLERAQLEGAPEERGEQLARRLGLAVGDRLGGDESC